MNVSRWSRPARRGMPGPEVATGPRRLSTVLARAPSTRDHSALGVRRWGAVRGSVLASCSWCWIPRSFADRPDTSSDGRCVLPAAVFRRVGGVWCELDGEVDVNGGGDPLAQEFGRVGEPEPGSQGGSHHAQPPGHIRRRRASVCAGERLAGRRRTTSSNRRELIWEQEAAGSNPAIPTDHVYFSNIVSRCGSRSGSQWSLGHSRILHVQAGHSGRWTRLGAARQGLAGHYCGWTQPVVA
jgi:hypothetical protein